MKRRTKWLLGASGALAVITGLLVVTGLLVLRSDWFAEKVRERIIAELEKATGGDVTVETFHFDRGALRAEVRGLTIRGLEEDSEPALFQAESVAVGLKIVSILRRKVDLALLEVESPRVNILVDAQGRTNIPSRPDRPRDKAPVETFLDLAVSEYAIRGGEFRYADRRTPLDIEGRDLELSMAFDRMAHAYDGRFETAQLRVAQPLAIPIQTSVAAHFRLDAAGVTVNEGRLILGQSRIDWTGSLRDFDQPLVQGRFDGRVRLADVVRPLRLPVEPAGEVAVAGTARFAVGEPWEFSGSSRLTGVEVRQDGFQLAAIRGIADWRVGPDGLHVSSAQITAGGGRFVGEVSLTRWRDLRAEGRVAGFSLAALAALFGREAPVWSATVSGPIQVTATIQGGRLRGLRAGGTLDLQAGEDGIPLNGRLETEYDMAAAAINFANSHLELPHSRINFEGSTAAELRVGLVSRDLDDFLPALGLATDDAPDRLPVRLQQGMLQWNGTVTGALTALCLRGDLDAGPLLVEGRRIERVRAQLTVSPEELSVGRLTAEGGGMRLQGSGSLLLSNWRVQDSSRIDARLELVNASTAQILAEAGSNLPVTGTVAGSARLRGTMGAPDVHANLQAGPLTAWGEKIDRITAEVTASRDELRIVAFEASAGQAMARGSGRYRPLESDWEKGTMEIEAEAQRIRLGDWEAVRKFRPGLGGIAAAKFTAALSRPEGQFTLAALNGEASIRDLSDEEVVLGDAELSASTRGNIMAVALQSRLGEGVVTGNAEWSLTGASFGLGQVEARRINFELLHDVGIIGGVDSELPFQGSFDADFGFSGPVLNPANWTAALKISRLEIAPRVERDGKAIGREFALRNDEPMLAYLDGRGLRVQSARVSGDGTQIEATGTISFQSRYPWNLQLRGALSLPVLGLFEPDLVAEGMSTLDAAIRGSLDRPQITGTMEVKDAAFYLKDLPNGMENVNGLIRFDRNRAAIEKLTAQTGGGSLNITGFVGFGTGELVYRLQAQAQRVRVRYPASVSTTADAALSLSGTAESSLLSGVVTINRIGLTPRTDIGDLLAGSSSPTPAAGTQSTFLRGMQMDIRVETADNAELVTALTRDVQPEANLTVRGTVPRPIVLGTVTASEGEIQFFGGQYRITRGEVSFFNPVKIEPVLDLDLETRVRGITVTINVAGPVNQLNMSYRSDPPLQPNEIIALLTVGRAPGTVSGVATPVARQQGGLNSSGNSLLGSALATPLSGRLQRFFGVSRLKIDPELTGVSNTPVARLTVEQQLTRDTTVTYITNLNRTQYQIVRMQWDFSRNFSVLAIREENGIFSLGFQYQRRFK